ncbi:MAG: hypothetical protein A2X77_00880 [Gammaproteobacteria bacterium GWE2_42_36]|nr:MAG: hypothetical protein A2X77_00880 [Gammaproteobacteria bacterium GWE2_42_36]HCU05133.1 hypothetical protein [Coxiellaceae bacterium]
MFTDVFIRRPVFATALSLILFLIGIVSFKSLSVRLFPRIDTSVVTVTVTYNGANAQLMEGFVTTPIENALSGVDGIDFISSTSKQNESDIIIHMQLGWDIDNALSEISSKVSSVRWQLPKDINDPVIDKNDPNASPIMYLSFPTDGSITPQEATDYLIRVVQPQLQTVTGVGQAQFFNPKAYAMRIWLDPKQMAARGVSPLDVQQAITANNVQAAAGHIEGKSQEFNIYSSTDLHTPEQFNDIVIRNEQGRRVTIKDVGRAELSSEDEQATVLMDGKDTFVMGIIPKSIANPLDVANQINQLLPSIQRGLPKGMRLFVLWDASQFIRSSLTDVKHTLIESSIFVFIIIFLMLGSVRSVFVPIITIPLSIVGAFAIMAALNYSINTLTLLAFVLAIGLVVDDSIVVLENIHRHLADGLKPFDAAIVGAREISFAIIAMTLTLAAVYAPVGFTTGLTGKLFSEFAFTLAGAVLISGFLALTLSPMMCSKLYKEHENLEAGLPGFVNHLFDHLMAGYKKLLHYVLNKRMIVIAIVAALIALCGFLYVHTPDELAPDEDQGAIVTVGFGTAAANLPFTQQQSDNLQQIYNAIPEKDHYGIINGFPEGVNSFVSFLVLKPWDQRKRTAMDIMQTMFAPLWMKIPGLLAFPSMPPLLPGASGYTPISFVLKTNDDYTKLNASTQKFMDELKKWGGVINLHTDLNIDRPQTFVEIHQKIATDLGIQMQDIATALSLAFGQPITTWFNLEGRSYQVLPELFSQYRENPDAINDINLRTQGGQLVPLSNLVSVREEVMPRSLNHFQQLRSSTITANLSPNVTQGQAIAYMTKLAEKTLPNSVQVDYTDQARQYMQASGKMAATFIFAIFFIYLILAAQFESFRDPFIVMLSVPLSVTGALLFLMIFGGTMNIYTQIGLVTLIGLITKNGILIVEFANQQQERGIEFREAIISGAALRLRPILMTTCAMLLGALPLVLAHGAGAVSRRQIGLVILGGMSFGTLLTLFVVPVAYYLFATKKTIAAVKEKETTTH